MNDYIKREDAITKLEEWAVNIINPKFIVKEDAICALKDIPSADVVEVVRCKDCKWYKGCFMLENDDDYCSNGERKEQENE